MVALMRDRDRFQRVPAGYQPAPLAQPNSSTSGGLSLNDQSALRVRDQARGYQALSCSPAPALPTLGVRDQGVRHRSASSYARPGAGCIRRPARSRSGSDVAGPDAVPIHFPNSGGARSRVQGRTARHRTRAGRYHYHALRRLSRLLRARSGRACGSRDCAPATKRSRFPRR